MNLLGFLPLSILFLYQHFFLRQNGPCNCCISNILKQGRICKLEYRNCRRKGKILAFLRSLNTLDREVRVLIRIPVFLHPRPHSAR